MYALKARDKMHKKQKQAYEERHSPRIKKSGDRAAPSRASTASREAKYVGSFAMNMSGGWKSDFDKAVKQQLSRVNPKDSANSLMLVSLLINMDGIKAMSADGKTVIMGHALKRILYCTCDSKKHLFAIVARNPQEGTEGVYTHVFVTEKKEQANEMNQLVSKAFKVHFASKTIARERKEVVKKSPRAQHASPKPPPPRAQTHPPPQQRSPSPQPQAPVVPPYNPAISPQGDVPQPHLSQSQPWTVSQRKTKIELMQEAGVKELEIATIKTRLQEIEEQKRELAGFEDAIVQLTIQTSKMQQELDERNRSLSALRFQIQELSLHDHNHLQPTSHAAGYPGPPAPASPDTRSGRHGDPLPDFSSISLEDADWFHEGIPREIAMEILSFQPVGAFMVRRSGSSMGYALSMKTPNNKIVHYLISELPGGGVQLQGSTSTYPSVVELVYNYTINQENLPCTLISSTSNPAFSEGDGAHGGSDSDDDEMDDYIGVAQYRLIS